MSEGPEVHWRPTAPLENLRRRAEIYRQIRRFFDQRGILEVETPLLAAATVTDPQIESFRLPYDSPTADGRGQLFLQTSPEYAMKRLLAAGSGPIYQICKAFRVGEAGDRHNPEFTMLEWYRPGFDHHDLMDEMDELLAEILGSEPAERLTWGEAFQRHLGLDAHRATADDLRRAAATQGHADLPDLDRRQLLDYLVATALEPHLGRGRPTYLHDFPADQAALAKIHPGDPPVAERFEVYVEGIELANGFHELTDAEEQRERFEADLREREAAGKVGDLPIDERMLAALEAGMPSCAGVAVGVDRLMMAVLQEPSLPRTLAFPLRLS